MKMTDIGEKLQSITPGVIGRHKHFAVLIPLLEIQGDVNVLYEVRSGKIKRQPGEICFPGGEREDGETDLECAIRETSEELGIEENKINIMGEVGTVLTYGGYIIKVYAGKISEEIYNSMEINEIEVDRIFTVPLEFFIKNEPEIYKSYGKQNLEENFPFDLIGFPKGYKWGKVINDVPIYVYEDNVIWGITGRITRYFANSLKNE